MTEVDSGFVLALPSDVQAELAKTITQNAVHMRVIAFRGLTDLPRVDDPDTILATIGMDNVATTLPPLTVPVHTDASDRSLRA